MPPKKANQPESDDFEFLGSQDSNSGDGPLPPALQEVIVKQYIASKEKKKQAKEQRFLDQASTMLKKDLSKASEELETAAEAMGTEYTKFLNEYAASEDRISRLWSEILKEHRAIESLFQKKYNDGIATTKGVEKQHISGMRKLRSSCEDFESIIGRMESTFASEGEDNVMMED